MTRALSSRVEKLEAKRRMHDDDLTRLSDEELNARIEAVTLKIIAEHRGIENAIEALRPDPICRHIVEDLERRRAGQTGRWDEPREPRTPAFKAGGEHAA